MIQLPTGYRERTSTATFPIDSKYGGTVGSHSWWSRKYNLNARGEAYNPHPCLRRVTRTIRAGSARVQLCELGETSAGWTRAISLMRPKRVLVVLGRRLSRIRAGVVQTTRGDEWRGGALPGGVRQWRAQQDYACRGVMAILDRMGCVLSSKQGAIRQRKLSGRRGGKKYYRCAVCPKVSKLVRRLTTCCSVMVV